MARLSDLPQVFQRAWRLQPTAFQALPAPRQSPRPAGPRRTAAWRPARPVRKEEPARRPRRGCAYLARRWLRRGLQAPGSRLQTRRGRTLRPSPRRQLRQSWPRPLSFSSTISAGKRKRKPPRGGPGPERAVSTASGPAARGGGSGLRGARQAVLVLEPRPPERPGLGSRLGGQTASGQARTPPSVGMLPQALTAGAPSWVSGLAAGNKPLRGTGWKC